uniref:toxin VasX n=1 Tax=Kangiella shandongensis TaxID=2763258 RepID=UPI001CBBF12C
MSTGTDNTKQQQEGQSVAETNCAGTIPIVPVRYAVVPRKDDSQSEYLYDNVDCGSRLEKGFSPLKRALYTTRALRSGYVYLYDETKATLYIWEADGKGNYTEMQFASLEDYHKPGNLTAGQTLKSVWAFEDSDTVHIGFTTNLLTQKMVEKVETDAAFRRRFMHPVNVKELNDWSEQPTTQQHMFSINEMPDVVEEYKGNINNFEWSNYSEQEQVRLEAYQA